MADLHATIAKLAEAFARDVLAALRGASLEDISASTTGAGPRAPEQRQTAPKTQRSPRVRRARKGGRRSAGDLRKTVDAIVEVLRTEGSGMRSEQLQKALGATLKDIARPIAVALNAKVIRKKGQKRGTTYFAV